MSKLYFRIGPASGFTAIELADKKEGYANPIRELLQNSLDASYEANKETCEINIYIETILKNKIPHIDDYKQVLKQAIDTAKSQHSYNENSKQVVRSIEDALDQDELKVLMFSDNGKGMEKDEINAMLTGGVSIKASERSSGSYGVGNLSSYSLSLLRYVLYATKCKNNNEKIESLFTGSPILAGHKGENVERVSRGRVVEDIPINESKPEFSYPEKFPDFIQPKMDSIDTGTVVAILGLSEKWGEDAEYAIASNFFHGIVRGTLKVKIHTGSKEPKSLDSDKIESIIKNKKDEKRAKGENILSGKAAYQALKAITKEEKQKIKLSNEDTVHVFIKTDKEADSAIVLIRNDMVIARHDSILEISRQLDELRRTSDFEPFTAVIDVNSNAPRLLKLIKGAEGPYHNKLNTGKLSPKDEKNLKNLLKELGEKIQEYLVKIERESFNLPLFPIPGKATPADKSGNKSSGQSGKAKPQPKPKRPPSPKEPVKRKCNDKKRPKPVVVTRNLEAKNAARYTDKVGKWEVKLRIVPDKENDKDDVYLSICLDEDNDREETKTYLDFIAVQMDGEPINVPEHKSQVKLGKLEQATSYNITAEVEKPSEVSNMKVALSPILGLKQQKKNKEK